MIRPTTDEQITIRQIAQNRRFVEWLNTWRQRELETLPNISPTSVQLAQGRCQVLTEICKLVNDIDSLAAQPQKR